MGVDVVARLLSCSRPVFFERIEDEEYPYHSGAGSAFVCSWIGQLFVITSRHVVAGQDLDDLRIRVHDDSDAFIAFDRSWTPQELGPDYKDVVALRVAAPLTDDRLRQEAITFSSDLALAGMGTLVHGRAMAIGGYPDCIREIDYDDLSIRYRRACLSGRYVGVAFEKSDRVHTLAIDDRHAISEVNGLSGSPIVAVTSNGTVVLAGIAIRGGDTMKHIHFLDTGVLCRFLELTAA